MGLLAPDERKDLIAKLTELPGIDNPELRKELIADLPPALQNIIPCDGAVDNTSFVLHLVDTVDGGTWAQQLDGSWSVIHVIDNVLPLVAGSHLQGELQTLLDTLKAREGHQVMGGVTATLGPAPAGPLHAGTASLLTSVQRVQLQEAILAAFPKKAKLEQMVWDALDENLLVVAGDADPIVVVRNLITWAEANGQVQDLVKAILAVNPDNPDLKAIIAA